jgi:septal ring factor EnvC (AmiA/AmiB activator)
LLNALLLAYLVPGNLLYDPEYYRWRLAGATLRDCLARHLQVLRRHAVHAQGALPDLSPTPAAETEAPADPDMPQRNPALWSATRSLSRSAEALQKQLAELETRYAAAIAERDEIWDARCWFQTQCERIETEMQSVKVERDTLRVALAKQSELDLFKQELALRDARYAEVAATLAEMRQRFDAFEAHHATAKAQNNALLEELNRTQRERIEALERAADLPSR